MSAKTAELNVVTGALGYTGKYIARNLLSMGLKVRNLTGHPARHNSFGQQISIAPFNFEHPDQLVEQLRGATTLYNTYWIRFGRRKVTFEKAIDNTKTLIRAAQQAGISRIVHVSITNASQESQLPYFRAKAIVEQAIIESGLSYAIIRPTIIFGIEDILLNNIAWLLRRFPVFIVPGKGDYLVQPVFVEDVAGLAVRAGRSADNSIVDAVGPEVYTFDQLVRLIARSVGSRARTVHAPPGLALLASRLLGLLVDDALLTRDELDGLLSNLLVSHHPATARTRLDDWLGQNAAHIGAKYTSELSRHYR